jgi:hypothetical protein
MSDYQELREECHDSILGLMLGARASGQELGTHDVFDCVATAIKKAGGIVLAPSEETHAGGVYVTSDVMFRALSDDEQHWEPRFRGQDLHITYVVLDEES